MVTKVYVGNLGDNGKKEEIQREFEKYGRLRDVWVARNPPGFAFVEFEDARDADDAIKDLDGKHICGARVRVELSRHKGGGRSRGGGGGGYRGGGGRRFEERGGFGRYDDRSRSPYRMFNKTSTFCPADCSLPSINLQILPSSICHQPIQLDLPLSLNSPHSAFVHSD
ncbi:unnamed protein product, partial [Porites evermanni]